MKWFWGFLRKYRFKLLGGLILTTFISVLAIVNPYVSGMIVDDVSGAVSMTCFEGLFSSCL